MTNILEATSFGATSTTDDVLSGVNLKGKRILVTGVSAGIGMETSRSLAAHGAQFVGAARDLNKAKAATEQVRKDAAANGGSFELVELDLANLRSVRACADRLLAKGERLDVVIANAGVMATPFGHTADGFETQFGTNHLGHFVLVNRIAALIRTGGRLINVSSAGHRRSNVDLEDPNFERTPYDPLVAYGRSKTANILFAVAFDQRHRERGVRAAAVHPGVIQTELTRHVSPSWLQTRVVEINQQLAAAGKPPLQWKSAYPRTPSLTALIGTSSGTMEPTWQSSQYLPPISSAGATKPAHTEVAAPCGMGLAIYSAWPPIPSIIASRR
jgi:NAD(P)-dependent dehydrogenase (short-subunit alcohol dehydrogenase family)